jgi:hypothetical protein
MLVSNHWDGQMFATHNHSLGRIYPLEKISQDMLVEQSGNQRGSILPIVIHTRLNSDIQWFEPSPSLLRFFEIEGVSYSVSLPCLVLPKIFSKNPPQIDILLSEIRSILGVTKSTLATIFGVTRPTIYSWSQQSQPRQAHLDLILRVHTRAKLWPSFCLYPPVLALTSRRIHGKTLAEWLVAPETTDEQLREAMSQLVQHVERTVRMNQLAQKSLEDSFGEDLLDR